MEKTRKKRIVTHHLLVNFKAAFDSKKWSCLYVAIYKFGIPTKLIRLCRIWKNLSEPFDTKRGFRQGNSLSFDFFNLMLERIIRAAELNREGLILTLLASITAPDLIKKGSEWVW
ncbi:unnamed protein product [Ceratitis capitata]|uniref:(Mediterranean fruit fly) hypothetical protein n=1 Tax=Ceratitis capitata TaxID=7213 RepID=A0A811V9D9_CERCA|nr:unnamed protein product [Ceratitis capitata]